MNEIKELFNEYLNPSNLDPEKSGSSLLEQFCASIDLLFEIIQNEPDLSSHAVIFLKRVLDLKLAEMSDYDRMRVFEFVTTILIPNILPQDPNYLSPNIYEIFANVSQAVDVEIDSINEYIKNLSDPVFLPFIINYLNNVDPSSLDLDFTCSIMATSLETSDELLVKLCVKLFVILCNNYPQLPIFAEYVEKFVVISVELQSPDVWNILTDLSRNFTGPFMEPASSIFSNDNKDIEERISAYYFYVNSIDENNLKDLPHLINYLVEFQVYYLNNFDTIDYSLFSLFPESLQIAEIRSEAFEIIKSSSFELMSTASDVHQVIGLFSLGFLIDNSPENALIEIIPEDLSIFHPFLASEDNQKILATFEVLKIITGKPICSHFNYEPLFQDVIELFVNGNDSVRNGAAIFSYKYSRSHFTVPYWIFNTFIEIFDDVKNSEFSIYLDILSKSILLNMITVPDSGIDTLVGNLTEILNSNRELEIKFSAASLLCSIVKKDAELTSLIANKINVFMELNLKSCLTNKTMCKCLIRFNKFTCGQFIDRFREYYPLLLQCSVTDGKLSLDYEPVFLTELIKWDPEIPDKDEFKSLLISTLFEPPDEIQYKIAIKCLKKIIINFPIDEQIQITNHICEIIFTPQYFKLIRNNIKLLSPILKEKNPIENRIQIAQIVASFLQPFPDDILKDYIGSICRLMCFVIRTIGPEIPENVKQILYQLYEKTMETHYKLIFFVFADCIRYSVVEQDTFNSFIGSAFEQLSQGFTSFDASCYLLCIKAGIEKDPDILNSERMEILTHCWEIMSNDMSFIFTKSYLANIFIFLGCHDMIPPELFVSSIQAFPMEVKLITAEVCQLFLENFQDLSNKDKNVMQEIVFGIIRLMGAGRSIRYTHKVERKEVVVALINLALELAEASEIDVNEAIQNCLPESLRKQETVSEFFHDVMKCRMERKD